jgi:peptide/nickel transport system permease protein
MSDAPLMAASRRVDVRRFTTYAALAILGVFVLIAIFAPLIAIQGPYVQDLAHRMVPPFWMKGGSTMHLFGTDQLGRDYFARLVYGTRISLIIGLSTVLLSGLIGISLGMAGGFFGGAVDNVVMFIITCRLSIPLVLVALTVVALIGTSLAVVVLTLGLLLWERFAVVARTTTMQVRTREFIDAARAAGASTPYILVREVLPNILPHLIVVATLEMAIAILLEAALSFLGLGVPPPLPSWGLMIAEARNYMFFAPWVIMIPGTALFVLVFAINILGDGMRDLIAGARGR